MAHLFFSYAHADYERLASFYQLMELRTERLIWIDKIGLQRDSKWAAMIERAIRASYGVIFAVTEKFITREFILQKEIPWAVDRFNDQRQGKLLFPILFDDVPLPDKLRGPDVQFAVQPLDARDGDYERVIAELKQHIPAAQEGSHPFVVTWPRLRNFKGRDEQLIALHHALHSEDGKAAIKTAGLYGTGGIGKTQLAVEFAYRYRFYFPGGVYWLNAAADWQKELVNFADWHRLKPADSTDSDRAKQMIYALRDHLAGQAGESLLVMDNVAEPEEVTKREIAPNLTVPALCSAANVRLLITTRVQTLPPDFRPVEVSKLSVGEALAVLMDAWQGSDDSPPRRDPPDEAALNEMARLFDYLPLPLGWMAAALRQMEELSPAELLAELRDQGVDEVIGTLREEGIRLGTPDYYEALVGAGLAWQIGQMERRSTDAPRLLSLLAAYAEAAIVPVERLRLLAGLRETALHKPFSKAIKTLRDYSLVEAQQDGAALRLHPLTRQHVRRTRDTAADLNAAAPNLTAAYRQPETLDAQTQWRGFAAVLEDLTATQAALTAPQPDLNHLARLFTLESHKLLTIPDGAQAAYVVQQIRDRAHHQSDEILYKACDNWLMGKRHVRALPASCYPASGSLLRTLSGHTGEVDRALELRDGRLLSWSKDGTLRLWDAQGTELAVLSGHQGWVSGAIELRDGRLLSWSKDGTLRLWDAQGQPLAVLSGHQSRVSGALELRDGRLLSWTGESDSSDNTLRLWDAQGQPLAVLSGHQSRVSGALELRDGRLLSWSGDKTLRLWDAQGQPSAVLSGHQGMVYGALELRDGRLLSWSSSPFSHENTLRLWDAQGQPSAVLRGHQGMVHGRVYGALERHDGRLLSWSGDKTLRLWDAQGQPSAVLRGHQDRVYGALERHDGRLLSWSEDKTLRLWDAQGAELAVLSGHQDRVSGALELRDGRLLSWSGDKTLRLWGAQGAELAVLSGHQDSVSGVLELRDGRLLSWSGDKTLRLWDAQGQSQNVLSGHQSSVYGALELHDGRLLSWSGDNTLRLWDAQGAELAVLSVSGHQSSVYGALELRDGRLLSWSGDNMLRLWDAQGAELAVLSVSGHQSSVYGALERHDGRLLSWSSDNMLRLWDAQGAELAVLSGHQDRVYGALERHDGRLLSWSGDKTLRLWDVQGAELAVLSGHQDSVSGVLELRDGRLLSWSGDKTLRLWDAQGQSQNVLSGHQSSVYGALELRDGRLLSWSWDTALRLWDAQGAELAVLSGHQDSVDGALERHDGRLLSWSGDNTLRLWDAQGAELAVLSGHQDSVDGVLELRDGRLLSWGNTLRLWSSDGKPLAVYNGEASITCCVELSSGRIAIGDKIGRVLVLELVESA